jgi:hypothetical protein
LGSQRPGGHKVHLEAAEEKEESRQKGERRGQSMAAEESCRDSIKKEKRDSFKNRKES